MEIATKTSAMMRQFMQTKEQYKDCILFYRCGDFYEMFNEDAIVASRELDLTLTGKDCGLEERAPMCGIPHHAYESYAQRLIEKGYKVAICEQTDKFVDKVMQREVVRIITPGTVVDSSMLNDSCNTYFMSIYKLKNAVSYAYGDLSTGEIYVGEYNGENAVNYINDQIVKVNPSEIICNSEVKELEQNIPCLSTIGNFKLNEYYDWAFSYSNAEKLLIKQYSLASLSGYDFTTKNKIIAVGAMLQYFNETQKRELKHLFELINEPEMKVLHWRTSSQIQSQRSVCLRSSR